MFLTFVYCYITTGAISISEMINTPQALDISSNPIGDEGIAAIARTLDNASISKLGIHQCNITVTGAKSLAGALKINHTLKSLIVYKRIFYIRDAKNTNNITVDGAIAILEAAVTNGVCQKVIIDDRYKSNDKVKELMSILGKRRKQEVARKYDISYYYTITTIIIGE